MPQPCDIGLIGLAVMGENLALNIESRGFRIAVFNRTTSVVDELLAGRAKDKNFVGCHSLESLVAALAAPRKVMMMVKAGPAVDALIDQLIPLLSPGDVIIDGGNTLYTDTERRTKEVEAKGLLYVGCGVSGGEEGARFGPSLMPGGSEAAWPLIKPILQAIAAKVGPNKDIPCCEWVGPRGAGHYVKMVHNGIEYGDMQLICEAYFMLKTVLGMTNEELYEVFGIWNRGELDSYLIEITRDIFSVKDPDTGELPSRYGSRQGRRQGDRQMDEPIGSRPRRAEHAGDRGRLRPLALGAQGRTRCGRARCSTGPSKNHIKVIARRSSTPCATLSTPRRFAATPRASCNSQAAAKEHNWPLDFGSIAHAVARRLHHPRPLPRSNQGSVRRRSQISKTCSSPPTSQRRPNKLRTLGDTSS